jgi:hypothetical protein
LIVKRHCIDPTIARLARDPCAARGSAILDLIAGVDRRAGARIFTLVFGLHSFDHGCPLSNQVNISHGLQYARYWPYFGAWALIAWPPVNVCAPVNGALQLKQGTGWPAGIVGNDLSMVYPLKQRAGSAMTIENITRDRVPVHALAARERNWAQFFVKRAQYLLRCGAYV